MNRMILFRGYNYQYQKWFYGSLVTQNYEGNFLLSDTKTIIVDDRLNQVVVDRGTIGQYTGLYDKNNTPIYEGDILENTAVNFKFVVKFIKTKWVLQKIEYLEDCLDMYDFFHRIPTMFEVIGNIYDNRI